MSIIKKTYDINWTLLKTVDMSSCFKNEYEDTALKNLAKYYGNENIQFKHWFKNWIKLIHKCHDVEFDEKKWVLNIINSWTKGIKNITYSIC